VNVKSAKCKPRSAAAESSSWCIASFAPTIPAKSSGLNFTRFAFPPRWHYDILRALDYFQAVNARRDPRLVDGIEIVRSSRRVDGRWSLQHSHKGKTYFELERLGTPSRWNTLRALRVLKWWDRGA